MKEKQILELKKRAKEILANIQIDIANNDLELITFLQEIKEGKIEETEFEILDKTLKNIEKYFYTKMKMQIEVNDYEYLKKIAEILRTQKIRIEDNVICGQPVFKILLGESGEDEVYYFITRDGAKNFIETHSTMLKEKDIQIDNDDERRKNDLMEVTINKNLELGKIIDIIKRNY
ncbi:MAG TPA: hypothetical protein OIM61_04710 [Clostridiaceae bacterium]|nr:hypothetical protein [Clostridiaceae bacterium]